MPMPFSPMTLDKRGILALVKEIGATVPFDHILTAANKANTLAIFNIHILPFS